MIPEHFSCEEVNQELERQKDKLIPKSLVKRSVEKKACEADEVRSE